MTTDNSGDVSWGWFTTLEPDEWGLYHVVPLGDDRYHVFEDCPCCPEPDRNEPGVMRHKAFDGREAFELGVRKPS